MIRRDHPELSIARQCASWMYAFELLRDNARVTRVGDTELAEVIDNLFAAHPHFGSCGLRQLLGRLGYAVGRRRVRRLMHLMGLDGAVPDGIYSQSVPSSRGERLQCETAPCFGHPLDCADNRAHLMLSVCDCQKRPTEFVDYTRAYKSMGYGVDDLFVQAFWSTRILGDENCRCEKAGVLYNPRSFQGARSSVG